ncbi:MAG TPA: hypothetical protein VE621_12835 [Bryobacteraceae bacterium]|jgi:hypothetical protein|nr:hypothetical protein [Bryobacteraceae bacterium]
MNYQSSKEITSQVLPGVHFEIARMSFARRLALTAKVKDLLRRVEYLEAGEDAAQQVEASLLNQQIDELYLEWGLLRVAGLQLDGTDPDPKMVLELAPEPFTREILAEIKAECGLTETERKN